MSILRTAAAAFAATAFASAALAAPAADAPPPGAPAAADFDPGPDFDRGPGPGPRGPGPRMGGPGLPFLHGIDLSEGQEDRLFAIMHAQAPQLREQEKAERKALEALDAMRESGRVDDAKAAAQAKALGQAIAAQELLRVRTAAQVMALLTQQQKEAMERQRAPRD
ncbi:periplasmic heavy metal sensor [Massilia sp. IC2-278]|uniref:periplasmic heavy metal sensor n=1 Tax=Massilia sp. IC2-278 TaxID=2887200 RepID=UPI001E593F3A|nr:periplasmic heavy metal sensor [Massilia sp. IC2-278]MCC2959290.1 periplasmic heavy metal sensor [Massilia sp. IC2-278]